MQEKWQTVITPRNKLFQLDVKGLWHYRDLVYLFVRRNFKVLYQQTALGPLWIILNPVITTLTFTLLGGIADIPTDGIPQFLFYMLGNAVWSLFSNNVAQNSQTFINNRVLFGKVYFPRLVVPISIAFSNLLNFFVQMLIFVVFWVYYMAVGLLVPSWYLLLFPLLIAEISVLGMGCGIMISALTTKYRDLQVAVGFGLSLWMYVSPVIYPISKVGGLLRVLMMLNPIAPVLETLRYGFFGRGTLEPLYLGISVLETLLVCVFGVVLFNRIEKTFMDTI